MTTLDDRLAAPLTATAEAAGDLPPMVTKDGVQTSERSGTMIVHAINALVSVLTFAAYTFGPATPAWVLGLIPLCAAASAWVQRNYNDNRGIIKSGVIEYMVAAVSRRRPPGSLILAVGGGTFLLFAGGGCAAFGGGPRDDAPIMSPLQQVAIVSEGYTAVLRILAPAIRAGAFDDAAVQAIVDAQAIVGPGIDEAEDAALRGDRSAALAALQRVSIEYDKLLAYRARVHRKQ